MIETKINCIPMILVALKLKPYQQFHILNENSTKKRELYRFSDTNLQYFDTFSGIWKDVENTYYLHDIILGKSTVAY